ncbi:MAG: amidohydrolase [Bacteroidales bacterium]|jgi:predicted amidohydrolase YtcJ|nr:amidohydrolase [Bacteroidales bacterium]MDD4383546.1 amidohydrolase [Bacteroidales bacterium]MDY0197728.1 amidohydrolase [Tenuifilaceae bacterium]
MKHYIILILIPLFAMSCNPKNNADIIVKNATIYSVDSQFTIYQSMAIRNGKILGLGSDAEIEAKFSAAEIINLEGKPVYPGFIDPHCHFLGYGLGLGNAWLANSSSWDEVVNRLKEHHAKYPTQWVIGRGWNQNDWEVKEFPTKDLLDKFFPENPVLLTRIDGHAAIANTKALQLAGFNPDTTVVGGEIIKVNGKPTGVLIDNAINLVRDVVPAYTAEEKEKALMMAQQNCFAVGLTSVSDAGLNKEDVLIMDRMQKENKLQVKINVMLSPEDENFEYFLSNGVYTTPSLSVRTVKLFADGALGSRGALLLEPYSDAPNTSGLQLETKEYLTMVCQKAYESGYQVATHCIGDAAVRLMLDAYEQFLTPGNDLRWRIEHAQTVHPNDLNRFGELAIIPSVQTTHATSDMLWAVDRIGDRIKTAYIYNDLLKQNGWLPNGSDFPIEHINPLYGFYAGVARKNLDGYPPTGFQMENALSREQAIRAMTIWAAKAAFEEEQKGSLEVGKTADFVVLKQDVMTAPEDQIPNIKVEQTFVNGKIVYLEHNQ